MTAFANGSFQLTWSAAGTAERIGFMAVAEPPHAPPPTIFRKPRYSVGRRFA
jgi:hypothetical protein